MAESSLPDFPKATKGKTGRSMATISNMKCFVDGRLHIPLSASEMSSLTQQQLMRAVLQQSMTMGPFNDTKVWLFSRRRSDGVVDAPQPVYANSAIMRASSAYFEGFFNAGFSEEKVTSLCEPFPSDKPSSTTEYDYDSDSDLDDDELRETEEKSLPEPEEEKPKHDTETSQTAGEPFGRVIVISDVAYRTFKALVYYLYTGEVSFGPLSSQPPQATDVVDSLPTVFRKPQCSPKSMYRLADKFGIAKLKELAQADIRAKMTSESIVAELRTSFTSMYEPVRDMQVAFACDRSRLPALLSVIPGWMAEVATGDTPHAANVLAALFQKVATLPPVPPAIMSEAQCSSCHSLNLVTSATIFRHCNACRTYRQPVVR